jgi:Do/DeqQ family serine protease
MNLVRHYLSQRGVRAAAALGAAALLVTGATWQGFAANTSALPAAGAPAAGASPVVIAQAPAAQASTSSRAALAGGRESYSDIVKLVAPGVVTVRVEGRTRMAPTGFEDNDQMRRFFEQFGVPFGDDQRGPRMPRSFRQRGLGSGVIVTGDGYVLTNNHVVDSAENIEVELTDGRSFKAKLVGSDKPSDLALLRLEASGLPSVPLGNSDAVEVGDVVLAVGNPLNVGQTVTMGIISAKGRSTMRGGDGSYEDFLQTDAPINHGNSGGALVNLKGELVGINSQILSGSDGNIGIGFAIPANMARRVMDDLRKDGRVRRAQLGVSIQPLTPDMAESLGMKEARGAIVSSVAPGSAAERAGIKRGDVLKSFNSQPVRDINSLRNRVAEAGPGSNASVVVFRDGSERTLTVKLDEVSGGQAARGRDESSDPDSKTALGVSVAPLTPDLAARADLPRDTKGLVVQQVNPDSRAADAGIEEGDVILEANRQSVHSADDLKAALRKAPERPVLLLVARDGRQIFVTVRPS